MQRSQLGSSPAVVGHTDGLMNFNKTFFSYMNGIVCVNSLHHYNIHHVSVRNGQFHESCNMYLYVQDTDNKISSHTQN